MFKQPKRKLLSLFLMAGTLLGAFCMGKQLVNILEAGRQQIAEAGEAAIRAARRVKEASAQWIETASASQINFLIVGMDDAWSGSDVIMLASLNADEGSLRIVQIPRDTYINRENSQNHKLNSVFANAIAAAHQSGQQGAEAIHTASRSLVSFLETNLGVPIDHYVTLRTGGLRAIVDAVGGVTLTIPRDIDYDDNSQDLHIHLKAGKQTLNGEEAEQFVRFRSGYLTADYGRMDAQKIFLAALFKKIKQDFSLSRAISLATTCYKQVESDLGLADLIPLVRGAMQISDENVKMITLKGQSAKDENGILCEVLSRSYAIDLLTEYLLPRGKSSADLSFDPHGVFTAPGEIDKIYQGSAPYSKSGVSFDESDRINIR